MEGIKGESVCRSPFKDDERKVKDLWDHRNKRPKRERVIKIYGNYLGDCICNLTISPNGIKDTRTWLQNPHGLYMTKLAYSWMILKKRIGHNILLTFDNIARIRQGFNNTCPRCKSSEETLIHVMKDCPKACEILVAGGLNNMLLDGNYNNYIDWIEDVFCELDNKAAADFLTLLWNNWNDKNNMVFKGKMGAAVMIWERAQTLSKDFRIFNLTESSIISPNQVKKGWTKPLTGYVKVNVDASVSNGCRVVRVVARDHDGFVIRGYYNFKENSMDVIWAELEAFQEGLKLAEKLKVAQLIVESDSATLVNTVKKRMKDIIIMG
ncbi:hypothetical protein Godav_020803 [Gossypium davidsonii]|uniref:RNase H type-1 domain-containing protein n=1 Tax=Gossypium davidsonii TaxID=34287 RepID=A0A7J8R5G9_GOSDV|nr:hypothetical protein [Gossypium davidsonii]